MSIQEDKMYEFCKTIDGDCELRKRTILNNKEIDIYCPSKKVGIEYNGLRWHSEQFQDDAKYYHLNKTTLCNAMGIRLIHIFEDEWLEKQEIVKTIIREALDAPMNIVSSNDCIVKQVSLEVADTFLSENHIQGSCETTYRIGLYYKGELISLIAFCKDEKENEYILSHYGITFLIFLN